MLASAELASPTNCSPLPLSDGLSIPRSDVRTVLYEGANFANSKMDNFSLIMINDQYELLNFLKYDWNVFYVNAKQGSIYIKVKKKLFKAKTTMYRKA